MAEFKLDIQDLLNGLTKTENRTAAAIQMYCETAAKNLEKDAKEQAPWTDRTGAARQRLQGYSYPTNKGQRIVLAHGVDYGIWLELAHEKRFAIVAPLITHGGPFIVEGLQNLLDKIDSGSGVVDVEFKGDIL